MISVTKFRFTKFIPNIFRHLPTTTGHSANAAPGITLSGSATHRIGQDLAVIQPRHAPCRVSLLLVFFSLTGSAAFADTDDHLVAASEFPTSIFEPAAIPPALPVTSVTAHIDISAAQVLSTTIAPLTVLLTNGMPTAVTPPVFTPGPTVIAAFGSALDADHLEGQRGGAEPVAALPVSAIFTNGAVTDNRAVDVITGSNSIRDGAFSNASGLPIVIQNTGANVLIQSATIVNVQLR